METRQLFQEFPPRQKARRYYCRLVPGDRNGCVLYSVIVYLEVPDPLQLSAKSCYRPPVLTPAWLCCEYQFPIHRTAPHETGRPTRVQALAVASLAIIAWSVSYLWCWFPTGTLLWKDAHTIFTTLVACDVENSDLISVFDMVSHVFLMFLLPSLVDT